MTPGVTSCAVTLSVRSCDIELGEMVAFETTRGAGARVKVSRDFEDDFENNSERLSKTRSAAGTRVDSSSQDTDSASLDARRMGGESNGEGEETGEIDVGDALRSGSGRSWQSKSGRIEGEVVGSIEGTDGSVDVGSGS